MYFPGRAHHVPYTSIILVEPALKAHSRLTKHTPAHLAVKAMTPSRRDIWGSREEAQIYFKKRVPWRSWDPRVLDKYVRYGLRELPTALIPNIESGVTLTVPKITEAAAWEPWDTSMDALNRFNQICKTIPIHLVFGEREEIFSAADRDSLSSEGRVIASVSYVPNSGHLVVQESPKQLAETLWPLLRRNPKFGGKL